MANLENTQALSIYYLNLALCGKYQPAKRAIIENFSATLELHLKKCNIASVLGVVVEIDKMTFFVNLALS